MSNRQKNLLSKIDVNSNVCLVQALRYSCPYSLS